MIPKGFGGDRKAPGNLSKINQWERNIVVYYKLWIVDVNEQTRKPEQKSNFARGGASPPPPRARQPTIWRLKCDEAFKGDMSHLCVIGGYEQIVVYFYNCSFIE